MSDETGSAHEAPVSREQELSALFAQMVLQQSNMATMLLGKVPHPQTGQTMQDLEAARMFIDQLEMLEAKTKGNLGKEEEALLKHTLMTLRLAFVEAVEHPGAPAGKPTEPAPPASPASEPSTESAASTPEEESKKKFSKKY